MWYVLYVTNVLCLSCACLCRDSSVCFIKWTRLKIDLMHVFFINIIIAIVVFVIIIILLILPAVLVNR